MQAGFVFDTNKCVGCQACQIACSIENDLAPEISWRQVLTYNSTTIDALPRFHLSTACNHCEYAICIDQCPAKAITKNVSNGVVMIDGEKCIGCKYCSWVCPYDAPKFDRAANVMTKCTLCSHRLEEGLNPACVSICPTDALQFDNIAPTLADGTIPGLPPSNINPAIKITPFKASQNSRQQTVLPYPKEIIASFVHQQQTGSKISLKNEWTLTLFTFLTAILGGFFSAAVLSGQLINPIVFIGGGLLGMGLSTLHLGKKFRAYRAILNWRTSWLSREVLSFSLFMTFAAAFLFFPQYIILGYLAMTFALTTAFSMDMVYGVIAGHPKRSLYSAQVLLTMLLFGALFNHFFSGILLMLLLKLVLYLKRISKQRGDGFIYFVNALRIFGGIIIPLLLILADESRFFQPAFFAILFAELIDRIQFYVALDVITPAKHLQNKLNEAIFYNANMS